MTLHFFLLLAGTFLLALYMLRVAAGRVNASLDRRRLTHWAQEIRIDIHEHLAELRTKKAAFIEDKGYGVFDDSKWRDEIANFVRLVLIDKRRRRFGSVPARNEFVRFSTGVVEHVVASNDNGESLDIHRYVEGFLTPRGGREAVQWLFAVTFIGAAVLLLKERAWAPAILAALTGILLTPLTIKYWALRAPWFSRFGVGWIAAWVLAFFSLIASSAYDERREIELKAVAEEAQRLAQLEDERKRQALREVVESARKKQEGNARRVFAEEREVILQRLAASIQDERFEEAETTIKRFAVINDSEFIKLADEFKIKRSAFDKRVAEEKAHLASQQAERERLENYERRIASYAIDKYTSKGYPKLVAKYRSRLPEIESLRRTAAEMAIDSGKCDVVENVQLSDQSQTKSLVFFLDCKNQSRIYLTETEIQNRHPVKTQSEKAWRHGDAITECRAMVRARAVIPSSVDFHTFTGTDARTAPSNGNVVVSINYDASNAFGAEIGYTARCIFPPEKSGEIEIFLR